jgi:hypothetical protein
MQLRRVALAVLVLGSLLPAVPASAAKPKPCKQITDDEGDGAVNPLGLKSPALDVLSADVSSGKTQVTAILRLKSGAVESDPYLKGGAQWNFNVTAGGIKYSFYAKWPTAINPAPALYGGLTAGNNPATPAATFTRVGNDFLWTVPRAAMPILKKSKQYIFVTSASTGADSLSADSAFAAVNTKYLDKTVTCLPSK